MPLWLQILLFAVPGAVIYYGVFYGTPKLTARGIPLAYAFWSALWIPVLVLGPLSILLYGYIEGGVLSVAAISDRFRFVSLTATDWYAVMVGVAVTVVSEQLLEPISKRLARVKALTPPPYLPAPFNPLRKFTLPPTEFFGLTLKGNWAVPVIFVPLHLLAMFSEEVIWRGLLLPVQIDMFGGAAWVINGMLWAWVLHACLKWHFVSMLPGMLMAPLVAYYTGSTWASFAVHAMANSPLWIILIVGVVGKATHSTPTSSQK